MDDGTTGRGGGIQKFRLIQHFQIMKKAHQPREGGGGVNSQRLAFFPMLCKHRRPASVPVHQLNIIAVPWIK
jgi:hypothetical protein